MLCPELPVAFALVLLRPAPFFGSLCSGTRKLSTHPYPVLSPNCCPQLSHQPDQITTSLKDWPPDSYPLYHTRPSQITNPFSAHVRSCTWPVAHCLGQLPIPSAPHGSQVTLPPAVRLLQHLFHLTLKWMLHPLLYLLPFQMSLC